MNNFVSHATTENSNRRHPIELVVSSAASLLETSVEPGFLMLVLHDGLGLAKFDPAPHLLELHLVPLLVPKALRRVCPSLHLVVPVR